MSSPREFSELTLTEMAEWFNTHPMPEWDRPLSNGDRKNTATGVVTPGPERMSDFPDDLPKGGRCVCVRVDVDP